MVFLQFLKKHLFWILPVLASLFILIPGEVNYWASDNNVMNRIAASAKEIPDSSFLVFIALPVSYILRGLYLLTDHVNWYALLLVGSISWAFGTIHYVLAQVYRKKESFPALYAVITAVLWGMNVYLILHLDFSSATFFMILAFCLQFFFAERKIGQNINMILLLIFGCSWRYTFAMFMIVFSLPLLLRYWDNKKLLFRKALALLLLFLIVWIPTVYTLKIYRQTRGYESYFSHRQALSNINDRPVMDAGDYTEELSCIGFSKNDIDMMWHWMIGDSDVFTTERLEAVYKMLPMAEKYNLNILQILVLMLKTKWNWLVGFVLLGCFLCVKKEKKTIVFLALCTFGLIAGYMVRQRFIERMTLPAYFNGVCFALFVLAENCNEKIITLCRKKFMTAAVYGVVALLVAGTCYLGVDFADFVKRSNERTEAQTKAYMEYMDNNDSIVLLTGAIGGAPSVPTRLWEKNPEPYVCSSLGGWTSGHPYISAMMRENGLEEYKNQPFCALLLPDVYYVVKNKEMIIYIQKFLQEHYHYNTEYEIVQQVRGYNVIKFSNVP